jgi:hypothetical protein
MSMTVHAFPVSDRGDVEDTEMAQRVNFEPIPGTRHDQYIFKLRMVLGYLNQPGGTKFKGFRDFLRKQNLWDKDKSETIFSLVEITWDKKDVKLGKTAKKLAAAHSDTDFQQALFDRLREQNILLVKYVLEALDVTQGGRLHSVHELYRMITSYVYPGAYITLTAFQAWVDWMAASGFIKLVGIRWALSERGQKVVGELRSMDVDEILEDMADAEEEEGEADEDEDDEEEEDEPAPRAAAKPQSSQPPAQPARAAAKPAKAPAPKEDIDDDEDLFADLPPEPEAPDEDAIAAAAQRLGLDEEEDDDDAPPPKPAAPKYSPPASLAARPKAEAKPARAATISAFTPPPAGATAVAGAALQVPVAAATYHVVPVAVLERSEPQALTARVLALWQDLGDWPSFTAPALGVVHDPGQGDLKLLIELGVLATLIEGLPPQPQVFAFVRKLRATTFFASLGHGEGFEEALDALESLAQEPWARPLYERLVHARGLARRVGMKIDLLYQMKQAASGRDLIALLREHMTGAHFVEAPFWVARELVRMKVLTELRHRSAVAVPTPELIAAAAAVGIASRPVLNDVEGLTALSEAVSLLFGTPEGGYGEALAALSRGLGLTLR